MTIGKVVSSPIQLPAERPADDARRPGPASRHDAEPGDKTSPSPRQDFVLGQAAYRRVLATLESDRSGAQRLDSSATFTGQRAQRSYQDASQLNERESLSSLFGVDLFV